MEKNLDRKTDKNVIFWINRQLEDPITKIMLKNTHLTEIQLNTLLLDFISEGLTQEKLSFEEKARLRRLKSRLVQHGTHKKREVTSSKKGVSRGAFNRVLKQARKNVIKSLFTVILLGYLGFFEDPRLQQYITIAEEIRDYSKTYELAYAEISKNEKPDPNIKKFLASLERYLKETISKLAEPLSLK